MVRHCLVCGAELQENYGRSICQECINDIATKVEQMKAKGINHPGRCVICGGPIESRRIHYFCTECAKVGRMALAYDRKMFNSTTFKAKSLRTMKKYHQAAEERMKAWKESGLSYTEFQMQETMAALKGSETT